MSSWYTFRQVFTLTWVIRGNPRASRPSRVLACDNGHMTQELTMMSCHVLVYLSPGLERGPKFAEAMLFYFGVYRFTVTLVCIIAVSSTVSSSKLVYKSLMGSPSEFPRHVTPSPLDSAVSSRSDMLPWASFGHGQPYLGTFEVDSTDYVTLAVISKTNADLQSMNVKVTDPTRAVVEPSLTTNESIGMDGLAYPTLTVAFLKPMVGQWSLEIAPNSDDVNSVMQAAVLIGYSGPVIWHTSIDSHDLLTGCLINIQAVATDEEGLGARKSGEMPRSLGNAFIDDAVVTLFNPNNTTVVQKMALDLTGEVDGPQFELTIRPTVPGTYRFWTQAFGFFRTGNKSVNFQRSSWMTFCVVEKSVSLTGNAYVHSEYLPLVSDSDSSGCIDTPHFWIAASVNPEPSINPQYRVYAEVWGKHFISGRDVPIAWISGMSDISDDVSSTHSVSLRLDIKWLLKAFAFPPYSLRSVRVEEVDNFISVSTADHITIGLSDSLSDQLKQIIATNGSQLNSCKFPAKPLVSNHSKTESQSGGKLILVHGYCTSELTFPKSQFTDAAFFEDFEQSRTTDEFARLIHDFGDQFESFGLAAHSHGGVASLHLYTYYESGLDKAVRFLKFIVVHCVVAMVTVI